MACWESGHTTPNFDNIITSWASAKDNALGYLHISTPQVAWLWAIAQHLSSRQGWHADGYNYAPLQAES